MRNKLALVVAVIMALIAVYGVRQLISRQNAELARKNPMTRVAAAAQRIEAGTVIRPNMLLRETRGGQTLPGIEISESAVTVDNVPVSEQERLIGQTINRTVQRGDQLLASYFVRPVEKLDQKLPRGERAISLHVDAISGVAGNVVPGGHVDIIGTFPSGAPASVGRASAPASGAAANHTLLLLSNVTVIAVDNRTRDEEYGTAAGGSRGRNYSSVTIAVTPEEANLLVFAQQYGTLTLALRSPADSGTVAGPMEVSDRNLLDTAAQAQKAREERVKGRTPIETAPAE